MRSVRERLVRLAPRDWLIVVAAGLAFLLALCLPLLVLLGAVTWLWSRVGAP